MCTSHTLLPTNVSSNLMIGYAEQNKQPSHNRFGLEFRLDFGFMLEAD